MLVHDIRFKTDAKGESTNIYLTEDTSVKSSQEVHLENANRGGFTMTVDKDLREGLSFGDLAFTVLLELTYDPCNK